MPHLYLPSDHTDADLVLAADVAAAVSSAELYVTWTIDEGQGVPEVEAILRDERQPVRPGPFADLVIAIVRGIGALWRSVAGTTPPNSRPQHAPADAERAAGEPSL